MKRWLLGSLAAVVAVVGAWFVVVYRHAGAQLGRERTTLDASKVQLTRTRTDLAAARRDTEITKGEISKTRTATQRAVDERTWYDALVEQAQDDVASTEAELDETALGRFFTAVTANQTKACFDGVAAAVRANGTHDDKAAASAMRAASDSCARTIALATGAEFPYDLPDPSVVRDGGAYYAYSTNSGGGDIQVIRSTDLANWQLIGEALPAHPVWAQRGATWAPSVFARHRGFVMYYSARERSTGRQCITRAVAATATGPFVDNSTAPMVCDPGGSIDPSPFVDADGRAYLLWKSEGSIALWSRPLSADGLAFTAPPSLLITPDRAFERGVVEAPSLVREGGRYFLVYSANDWNSRSYAVAYATCFGPRGPCGKPRDGRILASNSQLTGPGGAEAFRDGNGDLWFAFHAFSGPDVGYPNSRYFHVAPVHIDGERLRVDVDN